MKTQTREALTIATHAGLMSVLYGVPGVKSVGLDLTGAFVIVRFDDGRAFAVEVREEHGAAAA